MKISHSKLKGCVIIEPRVFGDDRGFFLETFQAVRYEQEAGMTCHLFKTTILCQLEAFLEACIFRRLNHRESWFVLFAVKFMMLP
jgi:hypothetical protein